MRYLSLLVADEIVAQIPAENISDEQAQALDAMLRRWGRLDEETEVAITLDFVPEHVTVATHASLWLDDVRPMPDGFDIHVKTAHEAIAVLKTAKIKKVSLDHDLGDEANGTGYDVARWIEEAAFNGELAPLDWAVHSQNPVGVEKMKQALQNADRFWMKE
jgi:hypothetical protein